MNFGLKDFFMGVVHLFVIFLPGSLLFLTVLVAFPEIVDVLKPLPVSGAGLTVLFIGVSYFLGHLVSLIASAIEDIFSLQPWRKREPDKDERTIQHSWADQHSWAKKLKVWREGGEKLRATALEICERELDVGRDIPGDTRRWAQHLVRLRDSELRAEIDAKDADRRFFRNVRWVLFAPLILAAAKASNGEVTWAHFTVLVVVTVLAWLRYKDQDWKFTKLVFESLVILDSTAKTRD